MAELTIPNSIPANHQHIIKGVSIMKKVMVGEDPSVKFPESANVVSATYCVASGDLAGSGCAETLTGWYKKDNLPGNCTRCYGDSNGIWDIPSDSDSPFWNSGNNEENSGVQDILG